MLSSATARARRRRRQPSPPNDHRWLFPIHWTRTLNSPILARCCRARIGAPRGPCLLRSAGSASPRPSRPAARDTRARASELQQAPRPPASSATVPTHKVTVHDRQRGVVHEFVVPEVRQPHPRLQSPERVPLHCFCFFLGEESFGMVTSDMSLMVAAGAGPVHSPHRGGAGHQAAVCVPPW
jgi:hypothetical protein